MNFEVKMIFLVLVVTWTQLTDALSFDERQSGKLEQCN